MLKNALTYIMPRIVLDTGSSFNRHIRVLMVSGKYKLLANGARESGEFIRGLLGFGFEALRVRERMHPARILVLGVAGGTIIHMLHALYPEASMTGIDIDEKMLEVGRKYFGLSGVPRLALVCRDAKEYVRSSRETFDLVVIDIFIGPDIPDFVWSVPFLANVRKRLAPKGHLFVNFLQNGEYGSKARRLDAILRSQYARVDSADHLTNRFFLGTVSG